jgi:hypothetical protein
MDLKYSKWTYVYKQFPFQGSPKYIYPNRNFGMKIHHLATLLWLLQNLRCDIHGMCTKDIFSPINFQLFVLLASSNALKFICYNLEKHIFCKVLASLQIAVTSESSVRRLVCMYKGQTLYVHWIRMDLDSKTLSVTGPVYSLEVSLISLA